MKILDPCNPAKLKLLLGALQVIVIFSIFLLIVAIGQCLSPGIIKSPCISSLTMIILLSKQICAIFSNSCLLQTLEIGLCGLHSNSNLFLESFASCSNLSKSIV